MTNSCPASITSNQFVEPQLIDEIISDFSQADVDLDHTRDDSDKVYGYTEILIPAAITIYLVGPYLKQFSKNLANDHYKSVKKLLKKTVGSEKCFNYEIRRMNGEIIAPTFSRELSFSFKFDDGFTIIFLIKEGISQADAMASFVKAMDYASSLSQNEGQLAATKDYLSRQVGYFGTGYLIHHNDELAFLDWPTTSMQQQVSVFPHPTS